MTPQAGVSTGPTAAGATGRRTFDAARVREDFPILAQRVHGKRLAYLDSANTSQKPRVVIDAVNRYYSESNANIHRATHLLSERATEAYEAARVKAQRFVNAPESRGIVLTRGTTDGINLVAHSYGRSVLKPGDEIVISWMEHHSNIVPWQLLCEQTGARLRVAPIDERGDIVMDEFERILSERTRIVAVAHVSNALGTINPVREIVERAHARGAAVLVDGAQAAPHLPIDVQALGCDFYALSGHKMYGPTATGLLYGRTELLERMPPYQGGGDMIQSVSFEKTTYNVLPYKFEAGTPNIAGVVGFGAAIDYLLGFDRAAVLAHEDGLLAAATSRVEEIPGTRIFGTARQKTGVLSLTLDGIHPHDVGTILDAEGVAVRSGQHCAQPVMDRFGVPATIRASFGIYNTMEDVDALIAGLQRARQVFG
jgi:cysteine desulfurase/selenocysteine lyase